MFTGIGNCCSDMIRSIPEYPGSQFTLNPDNLTEKHAIY
jgi:hypothetical protein